MRNRKTDEERVEQEMVRAVKLLKTRATPWELNEMFAAVFTLQERKELFMLISPLQDLTRGLVIDVKVVEQKK